MIQMKKPINKLRYKKNTLLLKMNKDIVKYLLLPNPTIIRN